jgi:hypothetical protein
MRTVHRLIVAAMLPCLMLSAPSLAQCEDPYLPLGCTGVDVGPFGATDLVTTPDRRPVMAIHFYGATGNPGGLLNWWYDDASPWDEGDITNGIPGVFDEMMELMHNRYLEGWRRFILYLPAGAMPPPQKMASGQWWTLQGDDGADDWKRDGFEDYIFTAWRGAHQDMWNPVTIGVYGGWSVCDPGSLDMEDAHAPSTSNADDMCLVYNNVQPWITLGADEYWFDTAALSVAAFSNLRLSPDYKNIIRFGGEAIPASNNQLVYAHIPGRAWMAQINYLLNNNAFGWDYDNPALDPETTDLSVLFRGPLGPPDELFDRDDMYELVVNLGYTPWVFHDDEVRRELVRRLEGGIMDTFSCPEDLNCDGEVDEEDLDVCMGYSDWDEGTDGPIIPLFHGDFTGPSAGVPDGEMDYRDWAWIMAAEGACP